MTSRIDIIGQNGNDAAAYECFPCRHFENDLVKGGARCENQYPEFPNGCHEFSREPGSDDHK